MHHEPLRKETVRQVIEEAVAELERDDVTTRAAACEALGVGTAEWWTCRDGLIDQLSEAEDWIDREDAIVASDAPAPPIDSDTGPEFLPSHPTLALVQSAMDEQLDAAPAGRFHPRDPRWLGVLYQRLRARARGKAPLVTHRRPEDFRFPLPAQASVALVSDWGTGNAHARAVATEIARRKPDHVIHLGDVYYAGTPREVQRNFLDMWRGYGPPAARYWALNANHDMYSGGYGYFEHLLPALGQTASYFSLANPHWQIIGLDSAYVNHHISPEQRSWLGAQIAGGTRTILLTHHHLLSPFRRRGDALEAALDPYLASGGIYGWFWGHEHHLLEFADYRGVKCRCIGHGSLPYVPPDRRRRRHPADVVLMETRPSPLNPSRGMHGFAFLQFEGRVLHIEYVDEQGGTAWVERWD